MCNTCERAIYKGKRPAAKSELSVNQCSSVNNFEKIEEDNYEDNEKQDPSFQCKTVDNELKVVKINKLLIEIGEPPIKIKRGSSEKCKKAVLVAINKLRDKDEDPNKQLLNNCKAAFFQKTTKFEKIQVLTTLPLSWTTKMIRREFQVSRRMVRFAKKVREQSGFASQPPKKKGKTLPTSTCEKVKQFYLSDNDSRMMSGIKDCVTVIKNGAKIKKQKRLLLFNTDDIHKHFQEAFPDEKIGLTKFRALRPTECISAGQSGTHNVCVCKIHQNVKLQLNGLKNELKKKETLFSETYSDLIKTSVCDKSTSACFFSLCTYCPGVNCIIEKLKFLLDTHGIIEITYSQWINTDRSEIVGKTCKKEEFLDSLKQKWAELLRHDFLAKSQASYFTNKKEFVEAGEFIVCLDFAENYTFVVQNAIQSHHWSNTQATIHPYVVYYIDNDVKKHINYATSHGKGACDGLGGSVKRHAYRTSLQRDNDGHITTAQSLYEWANSFFKNINFGYCSQNDHNCHEAKYKSRLEQAITVKNTRKYHYFEALDKETLNCKFFSKDVKTTIHKVIRNY
ncbi:unnamed protein product [Brassicogethes aeneus]|uniref:Uncharacterized protein n=1 Tax=Brassicogethes aeneus TaxID=1431903 RepID=A0A9P0B372_BRAAE|nr:unnamed protein product [Brassicogethes aeneus]